MNPRSSTSHVSPIPAITLPSLTLALLLTPCSLYPLVRHLRVHLSRFLCKYIYLRLASIFDHLSRFDDDVVEIFFPRCSPVKASGGCLGIDLRQLLLPSILSFRANLLLLLLKLATRLTLLGSPVLDWLASASLRTHSHCRCPSAPYFRYCRPSSSAIEALHSNAA